MTDLNIDQLTLENLNLLVEVSSLLTLRDLDTVLKSAVDLATKAVGATDGSLIIYPEDQVAWQYVVKIPSGSSDRAAEIMAQTVEHGLSGWVARHRQPVRINDTATDPRWQQRNEQLDPIRSALCLPVIYDDLLLAVLTLVHTQTAYFTDYHEQLMTVIVNQAAVAIHNATLYARTQMQQRQLVSVLNAIPDATLVLDSLGHVLDVNNAALPLLNVQHTDETLGTFLPKILYPDDHLEGIMQIIEGTADNPLLGRKMLSFETRSERLKSDFYITMNLWEDPSRSEPGYVVVLRDVTTMRDLVRFKDEMLRLASHDLRSPLNLIVGYSDMIAIDTPDNHSPVHDHVAVIQSSTRRMNDLLEALLRVEEIRSSPLELHEEISPDSLIKMVMVNTRPSADYKRIKIELEMNQQAMKPLMVDRVLIRQAMENLINNAIKYTPEKGRITIQAEYADDQFHFVVQDNGVGIPEAKLPYVFEAFYRVEEPDMTPTHGSGLGLSLVKNVIERHGGQVWAQSKPGKGSRFGFSIPLHIDADAYQG